MAKHIKASFRSPVWSVCSSMSFFYLVDGRPAVWTEREHQECTSKAPATFSNFGRWKGRGSVEWTGGRGRDIWGFLSETWKSICAGGHAALWGLTVFSVYLQGMYEYLINESQAQGKCNKRAVALQSKPITHTHRQAHTTHTQTDAYTMPSCLTQLPKVSLTLQIPENLICSRANSLQRGSPWESFLCSTDGWIGSVWGRGGMHVKSQTPNKDFILVSSTGGNGLWHAAL